MNTFKVFVYAGVVVFAIAINSNSYMLDKAFDSDAGKIAVEDLTTDPMRSESTKKILLAESDCNPRVRVCEK